MPFGSHDLSSYQCDSSLVRLKLINQVRQSAVSSVTKLLSPLSKLYSLEASTKCLPQPPRTDVCAYIIQKFLQGRFGLFFPFIYQIIYLYQYEVMCISFVLWIIIQGNATYFGAQIVLALAIESSLRLAPFSLWHVSTILFWGYFLIFWHRIMLQTDFVFYITWLQNQLFHQGVLVSFIRDWYLEAKFWVLGISICF